MSAFHRYSRHPKSMLFQNIKQLKKREKQLMKGIEQKLIIIN